MFCESRGGERERRQGECQEKSTHRFPSFREPLRIGTDVTANRKRRSEAEAPANAAKFTTTGSAFEAPAERR